MAADFDPSDLDRVPVYSALDQAEAIRTKRILNESGIFCCAGIDNHPLWLYLSICSKPGGRLVP
jgi:hypothetical protein